ncbi:MAG: RidA family protein [Geminicoccales bacterium]
MADCRSEPACQATQISWPFDAMPRSAGSDLVHVVHIHVYLMEMNDVDEMNRAHIDVMGNHRPARTDIGV